MIQKNIKAIAFDFGGTLDIPGTHWFDFFWAQFDGIFDGNSIMTKEQYWNAYVYGERQMEAHGIPYDTSFLNTITRKLFYQYEYITKEGYIDPNNENLKKFTDIFTANGMSHINDNLKKAAHIIKALSKTYDVSIVSNYYGNLETILKDYDIYPHLNRLIDSTIVGIRKPNPAIWKIAIGQSGYKPEDFLIVGDSMKNDILPAESLGCSTLLITKKLPPVEYQGVWVNSLEELTAYMNI